MRTNRPVLRLRTALACLCAACALAPVRADTIQLDNGNVLEGTILRADEKNVVLRIMGSERDGDAPTIEMTFARERVVKITTGSASSSLLQKKSVTVTPSDEMDMTPASGFAEEDGSETQGEGEREAETDTQPDAGEAPSAEDTTAEKQDAEPAPPAGLMDAIERMKSEREDVRERAIREAARFGKEATPQLVETLQNGALLQRRSAAMALERIRDKRATAALIEAMDGTYQENRVTIRAWMALKEISGRYFDFKHRAAPNERRQAVDRWRDWFETVKDTPPYRDQLGVEEKKAGEEDDEAEGR